jgi:hypothetical protein
LIKHCLSNQKIHNLLFLFILFLPLNLWADCKVTLRWDKNPEPDVYYQLYMRETGASYDYDSFEWQGSKNQATVDQLDESETYHFVVRVTDAQGNQSSDSNEVDFKYGSSNNTSSLSSNNASSPSNNDGSSGGSGGGGCFIQNLMYP